MVVSCISYTPAMTAAGYGIPRIGRKRLRLDPKMEAGDLPGILELIHTHSLKVLNFAVTGDKKPSGSPIK